MTKKRKPSKNTNTSFKKSNQYQGRKNNKSNSKKMKSSVVSSLTHQKPIGVLVPFAYGEHIFRVIPEKPWGYHDHFLLHVISENAYSAKNLAQLTKLPYQLIIDIMIPFMKVGWVVLIEENGEHLFAATESGMKASSLEELPGVKDPQNRKRSFVIDPITCECYRVEYRRSRNNINRKPFQIYGKNRVIEMLDRYGIYAAKLRFGSIEANPSLHTIFDAVALGGEEIVSMEQHPFDEQYSSDIRYAIAEVDIDGEISGMPENASEALLENILVAADKQRKRIDLLGSKTENMQLEELEVQPIKNPIGSIIHIESNQYELVLGGEKHKEHLLDMIEKSRSRIIIHSTFIHTNVLTDLMPNLVNAAERGVQVDIMWGQLDPDEDDQDSIQKYEQVVSFLQETQKQVQLLGLESLLKLHIDASGSHSKFIICDHLNKGYCATFGSCNWLASRFKKIEASVCIASNEFVSEALNIASVLAKGNRFIANLFSQDLASLSSKLSQKDRLGEQSQEHSLASIQLVGSDAHENYLLKARDQAKSDIFVCSHRVSQVADTSILPTLFSNKKANKTAVYGRATGKKGGMTTRQSQELKKHYETKGFDMVVADKPQLHAKILTWDSNDILISSLNWLSASNRVDPLREIGIYVHDVGVANKMHNILQIPKVNEK